jgi:hypothetical protein
MYHVEADAVANVLCLDLSGRMDRAEIETAADEVVAAAQNLEDGFHIINDISGFRPPSPEAAKPIKRAQAELKDLGVDRVLRVADEEMSQDVVGYASAESVSPVDR